MSVKDIKTAHINYTGYLVNHNLQTSSQKHKPHPRLTFTLTKSFVLSLITCYKPSYNSTEIWFKKVVRHSVLLYIFLLISLSLTTVSRVHSTVQLCSSNQCDTTRLESKLTCHSKHVHLIPWDWTLVFKQGSMPCVPTTTPSYETMTLQYEECSRFFSGTLLSSQPPHFSAPLTNAKINHFSAFSIFVTTAHICMTMMSFDHDKFLPPFVIVNLTILYNYQ